MFVCLSVCLFVRHTFSLRLTFFLPPLPKDQCPNFTSRIFLVSVLLSASVKRFFVSRKRDFLDNVHHSLYVTYHMSLVMCHVSRVMCHVSHVACHVSHVMCHMSQFLLVAELVVYFDKIYV